ncbi:uncharacterized protein LOC134784092 [Penaeus indicus]|uniref:uncharacterized protein LOC134784092 n=1 Tax=Penaeus indicus TaxID=29960 RepID=UPI00300C6DFB
MALHGRPQTLLVSAALVAACGFLLLVPRIASELIIVHTNDMYSESLHGKPVVQYKKLNTFVHSHSIDLSSDKALTVEAGTLGCIPVPKCLEEYNPCPFGSNGERRKLASRKANQTVILHINNTETNTIELKNYTFEVATECFCEPDPSEDSKAPPSEGPCLSVCQLLILPCFLLLKMT